MGQTATCKAQIDGKADEGQALLETAELIFRGTTRLRVPFAAIRKIVADGETLSITYQPPGGQRANAQGKATARIVLALGPKAVVWRAKIENPPSRLDKLGVKPGMKVAVWGALAPDALAELQARAEVHEGKPRGGEALVFLAVDKPADLSRLALAAAKMAPDGAVWLIRQKKTKTAEAPVSEAQSMAAGKAAGLVDTKVAAFSVTHTAERYVIPLVARKR